MSSGSDVSSPDALVDNSRCGSEAGDLGVSDSDDDEAPPLVHAHQSPDNLPDRWHVLGLGQAMVILPFPMPPLLSWEQFLLQFRYFGFCFANSFTMLLLDTLKHEKIN